MDTSRYRAFIQAVDSGSLSRAAKEIGFTTSGVSQLISALEKSLGFAVLERTKRGVVPTQAGSALLSVARAVVQEEDRLLQIGDELRGLATGSVVIGTYPSVAIHWLPRIIKKFRELYPSIEITVMEGIHQEIEEWLVTHQVDIAFIPQGNEMEYEWKPLAVDPMVALLPQQHPFAQEASFPLAAIGEEPFIMPGRGRDIDTIRLLEAHDIKPNVVYETIESSAVLAMVEQGMGISIVNSLLTKRTDFDIAIVPVDPPSSIVLGVAVMDYALAAPAVQRFFDFALSELGQL